MDERHLRHEELVTSLNDPAMLTAYAEPLDHYRPSFIPRVFGTLLVWCGNTVYGKRPSYLKFRAVEVIARVPYHSWSSALFTLMTLCYTQEERALRLSKAARFAQFSAENETMHVVVISALARKYTRTGILFYSIIPMLFAFVYFWFSYVLYLLNPRWSLELNYLFEEHAFTQYSQFLQEQGETLRTRPIESAFLTWYGRNPRSEYEFFEGVRNDELIHRNESIHEIATHAH